MNLLASSFPDASRLGRRDLMPDTTPPQPGPDAQRPLIIDLDGTLVATDTLWEGARSTSLPASARDRLCRSGNMP